MLEKKTEPSTQLQASKLIRLNTRMITNIYWKKIGWKARLESIEVNIKSRIKYEAWKHEFRRKK